MGHNVDLGSTCTLYQHALYLHSTIKQVIVALQYLKIKKKLRFFPIYFYIFESPGNKNEIFLNYSLAEDKWNNVDSGFQYIYYKFYTYSFFQAPMMIIV